MAMENANIEYSFGGTKCYGFLGCLAAQLVTSALMSLGCGVCIAYGFYGYNHILLAQKYGIAEQLPVTIFKTLCCTPCMFIQDINLVLTKEATTWSIAPGVSCLAPGQQGMTRLN